MGNVNPLEVGVRGTVDEVKEQRWTSSQAARSRTARE